MFEDLSSSVETQGIVADPHHDFRHRLDVRQRGPEIGDAGCSFILGSDGPGVIVAGSGQASPSNLPDHNMGDNPIVAAAW